MFVGTRLFALALDNFKIFEVKTSPWTLMNWDERCTSKSFVTKVIESFTAVSLEVSKLKFMYRLSPALTLRGKLSSTSKMSGNSILLISNDSLPSLRM